MIHHKKVGLLKKALDKEKPERELKKFFLLYLRFRRISIGCSLADHMWVILQEFNSKSKIKNKRVVVALSGIKAELDFAGNASETKKMALRNATEWLVPSLSFISNFSRRAAIMRKKEIKKKQKILRRSFDIHFA
jgi:hypothetical protein